MHARAPDGFKAEVHLNQRAGGEWLLRREPLLAVPLGRAIATPVWGLPTVAPEIALYYKALPPTWRNGPREVPRAHYEQDLDVLLPLLTAAQRAWLVGAVAQVDKAHPWVRRVDGTA